MCKSLAADGARGVERLLGELETEFAEVLQLAGCAAPGEAPDLLEDGGATPDLRR